MQAANILQGLFCNVYVHSAYKRRDIQEILSVPQLQVM